MMKATLRRILAPEFQEVARPLQPRLELYLVRDPQVIYANGQAVHRLPGEDVEDFKVRVRALCPRTKAYVAIMTTTPPNAGE
jgi:hypothetical protein